MGGVVQVGWGIVSPCLGNYYYYRLILIGRNYRLKNVNFLND